MERLNDYGYSFIESMLAVTIFFLLAYYFIPQFVEMGEELERQKVQTNAAEVLFNGARLVRDYGQTSGMFEIETIIYNWEYSDGELCVEYYFEKEWNNQCTSKE